MTVEFALTVARIITAVVFVAIGITHFVPSVVRTMAAMVPADKRDDDVALHQIVEAKLGHLDRLLLVFVPRNQNCTKPLGHERLPSRFPSAERASGPDVNSARWASLCATAQPACAEPTGTRRSR